MNVKTIFYCCNRYNILPALTSRSFEEIRKWCGFIHIFKTYKMFINFMCNKILFL